MIIGSIEAVAQVARPPAASAGAPHIASFGDVLADVQSRPPLDDLTTALQPLTGALVQVNGEAKQLESIARTVGATGGDLAPGEAIMLSMQCSEFMFHCELTATAANQSADGLQQLFRQQD